MAVNIGLGERTYQKTEVFDTAGNHTWTHPLPGQNIEVFVEAFGAGGGSQVTSGVATDGGDTIWDTVSENLTAVGGSGADIGNPATTGFNGSGLYDLNGHVDAGTEPVFNTNGSNHYGASPQGGAGGYSGNVGDVKRFSRIVNGDINLTVGAGGTGNTGNGKDGAVIISYNITTTQTPVVVNMQRRDWEHFGEVAWRTAGNTAAQTIADATLTTLILDTEVLDTGNKMTVNGDNTFTLEAGTYEFNIEVPSHEEDNVADTAVRLYNVTDALLERSKMIPYMYHGYGTDYIEFKGILNISSAKIFRIEIETGSSTGIVIGRSAQAITSTVVDRTKFQFKWRP
jgi:hypothetical protein